MTDDEGPAWDERAESIDPHGFGPMHYDRDGNAISLRQWAELRRDPRLPSASRCTRISDFSELSTVWLGIDHGMGFVFGDASSRSSSRACTSSSMTP
jgi:hypothetical protein